MKKLLVSLLFVVFSISTYAEIPKNFGTVIPNVFRGGILTQEIEYKYLRDLGVDTIINLEFFHRDSAPYCNNFNFDCQKYSILQIPYFNINLKKLKEAFNATNIALKENKKVYIHCFKGSDRTGALSSALMIRYETCGKSYDPNKLVTEVEDTLAKYNFNRKLFPSLYKEIIGWSKNPPKWICD